MLFTSPSDDLGWGKSEQTYQSVLYFTYTQLRKLDLSPYHPSEQVVREVSVFILGECLYVSHFFT